MNHTTRRLARRLALAVLVIFGAATATFVALHLVRGDPVLTMLGGTSPTPEALAQIRHDTGYDRSLPVQYGLFLGRLLRGDLGTSYQLPQPVARLVSSQLVATVGLAVAGFVLALAVAVPLAVATAGRRRVWRGLSRTLELIAISSPSFWVGELLLAVFSFRWHLFPAAGGGSWRGLALPAVTLALSLVGTFTQVLRVSLERVLEEPFVLSSRARGTAEAAVRWRHALRHALVPLITLSGWTVGALLSGAVVVETVFSRQGLGQLLAQAITARDLPVVTGVVVLSTVVFTVLSLLVDGLCLLVDPRLREFAP